MLEKLEFMVRFWGLKARHEAASPMSPLERGELLSLLSLMVTDDPMPEPAAARRGDGLPVQVAARGGFLAAELRHVCSAGLIVVTAAPLIPGQSTVVRFTAAASLVEYALPCLVEWAFAGTRSTVALRVDGAPTRIAGVTPEPCAWGAPASWRAPASAPAE